MSGHASRAPISGHTRLVGIFGDPVDHSRSPAMHNAAFAALGLDLRYVPFRVRPTDLAAATRAIRALDLLGVNVTVPHKEKILRHLDSLSDLAATVGAVNTVINRNGHLHGDNTDVFGFVQSLRSRRLRLRGKRVIVIGAGGAARAVLYGLGQLGVGEVLLANRTPSRARRLIDQMGDAAPPVRVAPLAELARGDTFDGVALVVNATSLGWGGEPFPLLAIAASTERCLFYDTAYGRRTEFLRIAQSERRPHADGGDMLIHQGARALTLWTGRRAPLHAMRMAFYKKY